MPTEPKMMGDAMGAMNGLGGAPTVPSDMADMGGEEDKEKGSIAAVKDLLTQAMDMLSTLEADDEEPEDMGAGPIGAPPAAPTRPPMNLRG